MCRSRRIAGLPGSRGCCCAGWRWSLGGERRDFERVVQGREERLDLPAETSRFHRIRLQRICCARVPVGGWRPRGSLSRAAILQVSRRMLLATACFNHSFAVSQSRFTVPAETSRSAATSSTDSPPNTRSSTTSAAGVLPMTAIILSRCVCIHPTPGIDNRPPSILADGQPGAYRGRRREDQVVTPPSANKAEPGPGWSRQGRRSKCRAVPGAGRRRWSSNPPRDRRDATSGLSSLPPFRQAPALRLACSQRSLRAP